MSEKYKISIFGKTMDYRLLCIIPLVLLVVSSGLLVSKYLSTGEWFERSIELRGGTLLTVKTGEEVTVSRIEGILGDDFGPVVIRSLRGFGEQGATIEMDESVDYAAVLERIEGSGISVRDYSLENIGSSLGELFWSQAQTGIIISFILMGIIAFLVFRTAIPSIAIIISAASDIIVTLALMQVFGIEFSLPTLGALLMLIGYSVDTDIMLTSRLLRESERGMELGEKIRGAMKTGLTMTLTSIGAVSALLIIPLPSVLVAIASVIFIGLSIDILNTWLLNSVLLRWYCENRGAG